MGAVTLQVFRGEPAVTLRAGDYEATFLPSCGMLGASLQYRNEEYLAWPRTLDDFRAGSMTALPLVHPWGNRLARWSYRAEGRRVNLHGQHLPTDPNGLPIHGNLFAAPFDIVRLEAGRLRAELDYGADRTRLRAFPFPHRVAVDVRLDERGLRLTTEVTPTGDRAVPISFCWHPYLKLPGGARRRDWVLRWPACEHVEVDEHVIPTGARTVQPADRSPIGRRTYDDHYALGRDRRFAIEAAGRALRMTFDRNYPFGQLFVPPRAEIMAMEPMTAAIDALGLGTAPTCAPDEQFRATFAISCNP
jgi:aldose 1-epimerase